MHSLTDFAICNRLQKDCIIYFSREEGEGRRETEYFHTHKRLEVIKHYRLCSIAQVAGSSHLPLSCMNLINLFATVDIFFHTVSNISPITCFYVHPLVQHLLYNLPVCIELLRLSIGYMLVCPRTNPNPNPNLNRTGTHTHRHGDMSVFLSGTQRYGDT